MTTTTSTSSAGTSDLALDALVDAHLAAYADPDADRRRATVERIWVADGALVDPPLEGTGHDAIAGLADAVLAHYPGHAFRRTTAVDRHHDRARYGWELVAPHGAPVLSGLDVVELAPDGRLARITGFFGELAPA